MKKLLAAFAAVCAFGGAAHAAADAAPRVLKPAGQWVADYGADYCRLSRDFSDGSATVSLALDRVQPGVDTRMILLGDTIKLYRNATSLAYRFLPSGEERSGQLLRSETADGKQFLLVAPVLLAAAPAPGTPPGPPPPYDRAKEQEFAAGIQGVALTGGTTEPFAIETGQLRPVIAALQACTDDLVKSWGIDPARQKAATRTVLPDGSTAKWLPPGTIGFADFGKLGGEMNQVRLLVDATGKPTDCKIHYASLEATTNDKVCKSLLSNARFLPALDADGKPFASYYTTSPLFLFGPPPGAKRR